MLIKKFEEQVILYSKRDAVVSGGKRLTYLELNQYANGVAHEIKKQELAETDNRFNQRVVLLFEHGTDMIIGLLSALKAGKIYIPFDNSYPINRLKYMLEDSEACLILTNDKNITLANGLGKNLKGNINILNIDNITLENKQTQENLPDDIPGNAMAYILYTSGSTGKPKGVIQSHENIYYYIRNWTEKLAITSSDRITLFSSYSHDAAVMDIFSALLNGATLYPYDLFLDERMTDLPKWLNDNKITVWHSVPTLFRYFGNTLENELKNNLDKTEFPNLRYILLGGEAIRSHDIKSCRRFFPVSLLVNIYGQTESSINTLWIVHPADTIDKIFIGTAMDETEILLINEEGELIDDLEIGEIIIACQHIALGYWKGDASLKKKFLNDPDLGPLYRTGDLGRRLSTGDIEFIGRVDSQVKIRGFRIEAGEIESLLLQNTNVAEALVTVNNKPTGKNDNEEMILCAYVVLNHAIKTDELQAYLSNFLPDYMVPSFIIELDQMPLTPTKKIDRNALPDPWTINKTDYTPPQNELQEKLANLWSDTLNIDKGLIDIHTSFFNLGGHSLKAMVLLAKLYKEFKIKIPLRIFFRNPNIIAIDTYIKANKKDIDSIIKITEKREYYSLSSSQKRLYILQQMDLKQTAYNMPYLFHLPTDISFEKLEKSFLTLLKRHESLRTSFLMINNEPVQRIHDDVIFKIGKFENKRIKNKEGSTEQFVLKKFTQPFDISRAPLLRVSLLEIDSTHCVLLLDMHHIITDGISQLIMQKEFMQIYNNDRLFPLMLQYKDFASWQNEPQQRQLVQDQEKYWLNFFNNEIPVLILPYDYPRPIIQEFSGNKVRFNLEKQETLELKNLASSSDVTLYMLLLSLFKIFLFKISGQEDLIIGTPVASRFHADLEPIVGMFVNTLAIRSFPNKDKTVAQYLSEVKNQTLEAFENQTYQFEDLVEKVSLNRDTSRNPIFDVMLNLLNQVDDSQNFKSDVQPEVTKYSKTARKADGNDLKYIHQPGTSKFDLNLIAIEFDGCLFFNLEYCSGLFKSETIERFIEYLLRLFKIVITDSKIKLSKIDMSHVREKKQLIQYCNRNQQSSIEKKGIINFFQKKAKETPDAIAIHYYDKQLSYFDLDTRANSVAYLLKEKRIEGNSIVSIIIHRSIEMIYGILGILKAGCGYLPIDPDYPEHRIYYMLADSGTKFLVTTPLLSHKYQHVIETISINKSNLISQGLNSSVVQSSFDCTDIIYVIYTSGTTGKPKGVILEQKSVLNILMTMYQNYSFLESDVFIQKTPYIFDVSVTEILGWFLGGSKLVLIEHNNEKDAIKILNHIEIFQITHINFVPSAFNILIYHLNELNIKKLSSLKYIFLAGEALYPGLVQRFLSYKLDIKLENLYGPTEAAIYASKYSLKDWKKDQTGKYLKTIPIGRSCTNVFLYILNTVGIIQPAGVTGELYIGGIQLGRGYLNKPELTYEKFNHGFEDFYNHLDKNKRMGEHRAYTFNKYSNDCRSKSLIRYNIGHTCPFNRQKIYKTGDLCRWFKDGNIEFLGRKDNQVKIRGYRIELGEIEKQLLNYPGIRQGVITVNIDERGDQFLVAYLVKTNEFETEDLRRFLGKNLPVFMIPSFFIPVDKIPLTSSGKIDRLSLPSPELKSNNPIVLPSSQIEKKLLEIWNQILGINSSDKLPKFGISENFFELGGQSLKATLLSLKLHQEFDVKVPLLEIFKNPTIRDLAEYIREAVKDRYDSIQKVEKKDFYPLSSSQKRLYILQQLELASTAYNMSYFLPLNTAINIKQLQSIFRQLIHRHESLRTSFHIINDEPVQRIHDGENIPFTFDFIQTDGKSKSGKNRSKDKKKTDETISDLFRRFIQPFNLAQAPLIRGQVIEIKYSTPQRILFLDMHHIITDGTSQTILTRELDNLFNEEILPPLRLQYKDFSNWQSLEKEQMSWQQQEQYWLTQFKDEIPLLTLPTDFQRPLKQNFAGNMVRLVLDDTETLLLKELSAQSHSTLYMTLLAIYSICLSKISRQEDIIVGTPIAARRHIDLQPIIGMFVNTLAIRSFPNPGKTFIQYLEEIKNSTIAAFENQEYQFEDLVERISIQRDTSRNPIFDVMLNFLNQSDYPGDSSPVKEEHSEKDKFELKSHMPEKNHERIGFEVVYRNQYTHIKRTSKFDLNLTASDIAGKIHFTFEYSTALFKPSTIEKFIGYIRTILISVGQKPRKRISEITILSSQEKTEILHMCHGVQESIETDQRIHGLFQRQAQLKPTQIAGVFDDKRITYAELEQRSNYLATLLEERGVSSDCIVGLILERSLEMILSILGILKVSGAYLPIDTDYPVDRMVYMLKDSGATALITSTQLYDENRLQKDLQAKNNFNAIFIDDIQSLSPSHRLTSSLSHSTNLVYIIYTSGTTGRPKGVMLEHRNVVNLIKYQFQYTNIDCSRILQFATIGFDASFHEIFSALLSGGTLYLIKKQLRSDIKGLFKYIGINEIVTVFLPMAFLKMVFSDQDYVQLMPDCLRHIQTAGDQVVVTDQFRSFLKKRGVYLHNHYGPTETHVVTTLTMAPQEKIPGLPTIGKPILNTLIYILDKGKNIVSIRVPGELYIGGIQVGRGYLNKPELTLEKFCLRRAGGSFYKNCPLHPRKNFSYKNLTKSFDQTFSKVWPPAGSPKAYRLNQLYKTGDLGRWLEDGNIEFLGRIDHQVKIRGFRVEVGEIENQLLNYPGIEECIVVARVEENGDKYLCAYMVSQESMNQIQLREYLTRHVPDYMIPAYFVFLENMPLTSNLKIDRKALPGPQLGMGESITAPRNLTEEKLVNTWSEVLKVHRKNIGIDCNFFTLGGQSLKATILITKLHQKFNVRIPLVEIFKNPNIRNLAAYIRQSTKDNYTSIYPVEKKEYYLLSSTQKRLFVLQQMNINSVAYNLPRLITLPENLECKQLLPLFNQLIQRHESLRTSFFMINDLPVQKIHEGVDFSIETHNIFDEQLSDNDEPGEFANIMKEFKRPFNMTKAPLLRVSLVNYYRKKILRRYLLLDMHHIISDGISMDILVSDYLSLSKGVFLKPLELQYKDYAIWQNFKRQIHHLENQEKFWICQLKGELPSLNLSYDNPRPAVQSFEGASVVFQINNKETQGLKQICTEQNVTLFMLMQSIFSILLSKISNQEEVLIGSPVSGRNHADLHRIIGMFVNTLVYRNFPYGDKTFSLYLQEVKELTLLALENQEYQFEDLVEKLDIPRDVSRNPIFDVMLLVQNTGNLLGGQPIISEKFKGKSDLEPDKLDKNKSYQSSDSFKKFIGDGTARFDLTLSISEVNGILAGSLNYCTRLFNVKTIERLIQFLKQLITQLNKDSNQKISEIDILSTDEKTRIIENFNSTENLIDHSKSLHQWFADQVKETPDLIAIMTPTVRLTYRTFYKESTQLACYLRKTGVTPDTVVAVMTKRTLEMMIGIFAILEAGGAYLPIDPLTPEERINYILSDCDVVNFITTSQLNDEIGIQNKFQANHNLNMVFVDKIIFSSALPCSFTVSPSNSTNLAYVIYTSGSTGHPKGAVIQHQSVVNRLFWMQKAYPLEIGDIILQKTPYVFDVSVWEIFWWSLVGASVCLLDPGEEKNPISILRAIEFYQITTLHFVPTMLNMFLSYCEDQLLLANHILSLKYVFSSGEALEYSLVELFERLIFKKFNCPLINLYGPTEATVDVSYFKCSPLLKSDAIPIGKPIDNIRLFILSKYFQVQPVGIPGELYIEGIGLARGYLNNPELTSEKFCLRRAGGLFSRKLPPYTPHKSFINKQKFLDVQIEKIYKTGDLCRWLSDGNIEFLGRLDFQVKIRGLRIELGEIEYCLLQSEKIRDAVVLLKEITPGDNQLVAYIVPTVRCLDQSNLKIEELRSQLAQSLPLHMVPVHYVKVEELPLTVNGKINRKALPNPEIKTKEYNQSPRNHIEEKLVEVWQQVLRVKDLGIEDNFFQLGGDSIKGLQISARLKKYGLKLEMSDLFMHPSIRQLEKYIQPVTRLSDQGLIEGEVPLTPIQKWFFENPSSINHHFNHSVMFHRLDGFDKSVVKKVWLELLAHHDALRMNFSFINEIKGKVNHDAEPHPETMKIDKSFCGGSRGAVFSKSAPMVKKIKIKGTGQKNESQSSIKIQQINKGLPVSKESQTLDLQVFNFENDKKGDLELQIEKNADMIQSSIDLKKGSLIKLGLFKTSKGDHLLIVIHHLLVDGISWRILIEDFSEAYQQAINGQTIQLPFKTDSYQYWARQLYEYAKSESLINEYKYWQVIEDAKVKLLPKDFKIHTDQNKRCHTQSLHLKLDQKQTEKLLKEVPRAYGTEINDILLAALGITLKNWCKHDSIIICLEGHGREDILPEIDVSRTVGWFTSLFPVLLDLSQTDHLSNLIKNVKETLRKIPKKGIGYGILKYLTPKRLKDKIVFKQKPEIVFNYLGEFSLSQSHAHIRKSGIKTGNMISPEFPRSFTLEINGMITGGTLALSFSYNQNEYKRTTIEKLVKNYHCNLLKIIDYCLKKEDRELTPSDLSFKDLSIDDLENIVNKTRNLGAVKDIYELTPMQSGILFHGLKEPGTYAYFEQAVFVIEGNINQRALENSLNLIVDRYDILRSLFLYEQVPQPLQVVLKKRPCKVSYTEIDKKQNQEQSKFLRKGYLADRQRGFDLVNDPLIRLSLIKVKENSFHLIWSFHHIIMDGWCLRILYRELLQVYDSLQKGIQSKLVQVTQFGEYIQWLRKQDHQKGLKFWAQYLSAYDTHAILPEAMIPVNPVTGDQHRSNKNHYKVEEHVIDLGVELSNQLRVMSAEYQVTLNTIIQTLWGILLQGYNNTNDVVFGVIVSGRPPEIDGIENMIGLFINVVPVRIISNELDCFCQILRDVQEKALQSNSYEYISFADIQSNSEIESNLIDHIMVFENYPINQINRDVQEESHLLKEDYFQVQSVEVFEQTNYNFNIIITPRERIIIKFSYNSIIYSRQHIEMIGHHFVNLVLQVIADPGIGIHRLEIITGDTKRKILEVFNASIFEYNFDYTLDDLFIRQVEKTADKIAVMTSNTRITYKKLDEESNIIARHLTYLGTQPDHLVALLIERSIDMIIGIFGILKAGGAYLPIDPIGSNERLNYILKDSGAKILLSTSKIMSWEKRQEDLGLPGHLKLLLLDHNKNQGESFPAITSQGLCISSPGNIAYVIYTSGSTGYPKGVMIQHGSVMNRLYWMQRKYEIENSDIIMQKTPYFFDVSVWEIFWWSMVGASVFLLAPGEEKDPGSIVNAIYLYHITTMHFVPAMLNSFLTFFENNQLSFERLSSLNRVFASGEALDFSTVNKFNQLIFRKTNTWLINLYGPTEATVDVSYFNCSPTPVTKPIPIGKPIDNIFLYIINKNFQLQPIGVVGELYIEGIGLARGYLNNPELTFENFYLRWAGGSFCKNHPLHPHKNFKNKQKFLEVQRGWQPPRAFFKKVSGPRREKNYKTGDLCRWLFDGNIEFIGRMDFQVKIRGFRIELGEIEFCLLQSKQVSEAVVIFKEISDGDKQLVAYIVPANKQNDNSALDIQQIKNDMSERLPKYMVPVYFVKLDKLPLNASGKINRKALPFPGKNLSHIKFAAPENKNQQKLRDIWSKVLNIDKKIIGIDDNFFELGGHSLKAILLISNIHKSFNVHLPMAELFRISTIRNISNKIEIMQKEQYELVKPIEKKEFYPLSSSQKRLYILNQLSPENIGYNQTLVVILEGMLSYEKLEKSFAYLIQQHESLRTSFHLINNIPSQKIHDYVEFKITYWNDGGDIPGLLKDFILPFDLSQAPLIRTGLIKEKPGRYILIIDMHHIITDGMTLQILIRQAISFYAGQPIERFSLHYKDVALWQLGQISSGKIKKQEDYWLGQFYEEPQVLVLPTDYKRPKIKRFEGDRLGFTLDQQVSSELKKLALRENSTLFMVIMTLFNILLFRLSGQEDIIVGSVVAGRNHAEFQQIAGMFVNTLAIRNYPKPGKSFIQFLREVRETTLNAFENQDYPFEDLVDKVIKWRDPGRNPLFDVAIGFQNLESNHNVNSIPEASDLRVLPYQNYKNMISTFDLTLHGVEKKDSLQLTMEYCSGLFEKETISKFNFYIRRIISIILKKPGMPLEEIDLVLKEEKRQLLNDFNNDHISFPVHKTIQESFCEGAQKCPDNIAVFDHKENTSVISYGELNRKSSYMASIFKDKGVRVGSWVAIQLKRSIELIIGLLGILKIGAAYLPIDSKIPAKRLRFMIDDSSAKILISDKEAGDTHFCILNILDFIHRNPLNPGEKKDRSDHYVDINKNSSSIPYKFAYSVYTSGSTGKPKGVLVKQEGLMNMIYFYHQLFELKQGTHISQVASPGFDAMAFEMWPCLSFGGTLRIADNEVRISPHAIRDWLITNCIDITFQSTAMTEQLLLLHWPNQGIQLKKLLTAGDQLKVFPKQPLPFELYNLYGPTEDTIWTTYERIPVIPGQNQKNTDLLPAIGKPIANHQVFIVNQAMQLQPIKVIGELCISGIGLAMGYMNNPELTHEKFIHDSRNFHDCPGQKEISGKQKTKIDIKQRNEYRGESSNCPNQMFALFAPKQKIYKTGDLARWLPNGKLDFIGRIDQQVKIRGFRIELGEIENQLLELREITDVVVLIKEKGINNKVLCAYFVATSQLKISNVKSHLIQYLPEYMIPTFYKQLVSIPLTINGKIDRKALPEPGIEGEIQYKKPGTKNELIILEIWQSILGIDKIGINTQFFDIGGNSMNILQVHSKLKTILKIELPLMILFQYPTISTLAQYLDKKITNQSIDQNIFIKEQITSDKNMLKQSIQKLGMSNFNNSQ